MGGSIATVKTTKKKFTFKKFIFLIFSLIVAAIHLLPIYAMFVCSLKKEDETITNVLKLPTKNLFTIKNYKEIFSQPSFFGSFFNSILISIISVTLILIISSMAAWFLARYKTKNNRFFLGLFAIFMLIPPQCMTISFINIAQKIKLLNPIGLILAHIGFGLSFSIFIIQKFIKKIPKEVEEAAMLDGCNLFKILFLFVIPAIKPILILVGILNFVWIFSDFFLASTFLSETNFKTTTISIFDFYNKNPDNWKAISTMIFLCILLTAIILLVARKIIFRKTKNK